MFYFLIFRFPSPITYCGMMEMASAYLPISSNWRKFYKKCETTAAKTRDSAARRVIESAKSISNLLGNESKKLI